jgi:hypothetical protein
MIKIQIKVSCPFKFSKNGLDLHVGPISVIFCGVSVFHVVRRCWCVC